MTRGLLALFLCAASALIAAASHNVPAAHAWFLKAREAERAGDDPTALGFYRLAFRNDPGSRDLCFLYLDRLKGRGQVDSSAALANTCEHLPGKPVLSEYKALGEIALRAGDAAGAMRHYRAALALDDEDGDALYVLAGLYEDERDWNGYAEMVRRLLPRLNYPAALMERELQAYARLDRTEDALSLLEEAWTATGRLAYGQSLAGYYEARGMQRSLLKVARKLAQTRPDDEYQWLLARAYAAANRPDSALRICETLLKNRPPDSARQPVLYLYAYLLFDTGRYQEAYGAARKLVKLDANDAPSVFLLGSAALELRKSSARAILERALALSPLGPETRARRAYADYVFKSPAQVSARLAYAVSDSVAPRQALLLEGFAQGQLARQLDPRGGGERPAVYSDSTLAHRHRREAVLRFEKVLAMGAGDSPGPNRAARFELASHLERLGERPRAQALLRDLVRQDTTNAMALNYLGYMLVENLPVAPAELQEADRLLDRALELDPENGAYLDSKGWWYYRAGALDSARFYLESAAEAIPSDPAILGHLAEVLMAQGRAEEACPLYREARRRDPIHAAPQACTP